MSLHTLAHHLQSAGRGEDKVLVHMTPNEVSGLQSLAMAHGGSLTINPQTGLPEAGFLSGILPMVAGAALAATGVGAPMAALMVGGAGAVATGSLSKGLMMGLGAYGGAGLGAGLMGGAEAAAAAAPAASAAMSPAMGASQALTGAGLAGSPAAMAAAAPATMPSVTALAPNMATTAPTLAGVQGGPTFGQPVAAAPPVVSTAPAAPPMSAPSVESATSMFDKLKSMPGKAFDLLSGTGPEAEKAREEFYEKNKKYLLAGGIGSLMSGREEQKAPKESSNYQSFNPTWNRMMQSGGNYQPSSYTGSSERLYFADGGLADLPVEQMSQQASVGANTNYPMANLRPYGYAVPSNVPVSENVFKPVDYERTDPYTGEAKFAGGGLASLVSMATGGFVSKLKPVAEPKKTTPKLQDIAKLDKQVSAYEKYGSLDDAKNKVADIQSQLKGLNKKSPDYKSLQAELKTANANVSGAQKYSNAVAARDKAVAANEAAINKANQQYEDAMSKYNEYKNKLDEEKKTWQEETGRKATGLQAVKPLTTTKSLGGQDNSAKIAELEKQKAGLSNSMYTSSQAAEIQKQIDQLKSGSTSTGYTPAYVKDPKTGKLVPSSEIAPTTEFKKFTKAPGYDTTKKLLEEKDITAVFEDVAGRRPTKQEMESFLGTINTEANIAKYAMNAADVKATMKYTDDDYKENFNYYIGRDPTSGEMAAMKKAKITNFNQLRNFIQQQPAYLQNLNKVAQQAFSAQQKSAEEALAEQQRLASSLSSQEVATAYKDALGRAPTMDELQKNIGTQQTQAGLTKSLQNTDEYLKSLTQPTVPTPSVSAPKYAPGTVLSYTPTQQTQTGLGAITSGLQPTASGLQTPMTRGAVTLEGAMPLAPNFQEQLGIQTLAAQAAEKAPALQTGMTFAAPQQNMFGFQPYGQPQQAGSPKSLEALLAELRTQQAQGVTQMASGGMAGYNLGSYSDGGRLLKGPGDGVSDSIPASIGDKQPARLANNEFVIPARIVSEIGNGSTDAGARKLYEMMDRVQRRRAATVGKNKIAVDSKAYKELERL